MLAPIVLAAGRSVRMSAPKALLPDRDGRPFVARVVRTLVAAGFPEVIVVTGATHDEIGRALDADGAAAYARLVRNPEPERGQLSSIWAGMDAAITDGVSAILLTLVDVPLVAPATVRAVVDAFGASGALIVRPAIGERHGHPVIFRRALFEELRRADPGVGAKAVVRAHEADILNVQVDDEGALLDVDTRADYDAALARPVPKDRPR